MRKVAKTRSCGDCSVCCTIIGVSSLEKPAGRPCIHLGPKGCELFGSPARPPECSAFRCAYILGAEWIDRPDECGIIAWGNRGGVVLDQCWPGATERAKLRELGEAATGKLNIVVRWVGYK
jgi:hypothetical protein